jgi:hypothetical protein
MRCTGAHPRKRGEVQSSDSEGILRASKRIRKAGREEGRKGKTRIFSVSFPAFLPSCLPYSLLKGIEAAAP